MNVLIRKLKFSYYKHYLRSNKNISIKNKVIIKEVCFEDNNVINTKSILRNVSVGRGTYIGSQCIFINSSLGRFCSVGNNVKVIMGQHPTSDYVSTHPAFYSTGKQAGFTFVDRNLYEEFKFADPKNKLFVTIGNDVWIGEDVLIMQGVKIGHGAIIGARSLVTKDVLPYSICVGIPAKVIRYRFDVEEIKDLLEIKWWDKDFEWITCNADKFLNISDLIKILRGVENENCSNY